MSSFENTSSPTGLNQIIYVCGATQLCKCLQNWGLCKVSVNDLSFFFVQFSNSFLKMSEKPAFTAQPTLCIPFQKGKSF